MFLCIWKKRLLKLWTFLLGWGGGAGAPSTPPSLRACRIVSTWSKSANRTAKSRLGQSHVKRTLYTVGIVQHGVHGVQG